MGGNSIGNNNYSYGLIKPENSGESLRGKKQMCKECIFREMHSQVQEWEKKPAEQAHKEEVKEAEGEILSDLIEYLYLRKEKFSEIEVDNSCSQCCNQRGRLEKYASVTLSYF